MEIKDVEGAEITENQKQELQQYLKNHKEVADLCFHYVIMFSELI